MANKYRQMLMDEKAYAELNSAKEMLSLLSGRKMSYKDVVNEFVGRRMRFLGMKKELRNYVNHFVSAAAADMHVQGVMLFGSVAKRTFSKCSDTDLLIVVDGRGISNFEKIEGIIKAQEEHRKPLVDAGFNLRISPLMMSSDDLNSFRPIYIDFLEDGVILFERNCVLTDFLNSIRAGVDYEKCIINNNVVVKWNIKE
ncbi:MAG: nucleotidyltransferase domain-containing protein [Cuniculiplasma sp.]